MNAFASSGIFAPREASAETIGDALAEAYANNADLDEQRANVRVRDEDVPKAATGMRPRASASVNGGPGRTTVRQPGGFDQLNNRLYSDDKYSGLPKNGTLGVQQPLFDGGKTENSVRQAKSGIFAARAGCAERTGNASEGRHGLYECAARHCGGRFTQEEYFGPGRATARDARSSTLWRSDHDRCGPGGGSACAGALGLRGGAGLARKQPRRLPSSR